MGGMTAASLLATDGFRVLILEASHLPGGCSSSYYRKGYWFETGATTLIGFDEYQPLKRLEEKLGITITKKALDPPMAVHQNGREIIRWQNRDQWIEEAVSHFGETTSQNAFWELAARVEQVTWKVSERNPRFPPADLSDWLALLRNDIRDVWVLPYGFKSVRQTAIECGISNPHFYRFLDEQLMISSQATSEETPFLFGAPALTYTNSTNYYIPGGMLSMVRQLQQVVESKGGELLTRHKAVHITGNGSGYRVHTEGGNTYRTPVVISGIPVWNMEQITSAEMKRYFSREASRYREVWGAFTMGIAVKDDYPDKMPLHHQIILDDNEQLPGVDSSSVFVSFSDREDEVRAPRGERVLQVSTHTETDRWFALNGRYDEEKKRTEQQILHVLERKLPYFRKSEIKLVFASTPVSWNQWVSRKQGRVGGIPQRMNRSLLDWTPGKTPFDQLYLCGDTVFPGQGIPGVALSGFQVYHRVRNHL